MKLDLLYWPRQSPTLIGGAFAAPSYPCCTSTKGRINMAKRPRRDSADSELSVPILSHQEVPGRRSSSMTPVAKISSSSTETKQQPQGRAMVHHCSLPPHRETVDFASYDEYETHYLQTHVNRCSECAKNFPTLHFLSIHIEENHDPLILARRDRGEKTVSPWNPFFKLKSERK